MLSRFASILICTPSLHRFANYENSHVIKLVNVNLRVLKQLIFNLATTVVCEAWSINCTTQAYQINYTVPTKLTTNHHCLSLVVVGELGWWTW
jgi:hypothetical protein